MKAHIIVITGALIVVASMAFLSHGKVADLQSRLAETKADLNLYYYAAQGMAQAICQEKKDAFFVLIDVGETDSKLQCDGGIPTAFIPYATSTQTL